MRGRASGWWRPSADGRELRRERGRRRRPRLRRCRHARIEALRTDTRRTRTSTPGPVAQRRSRRESEARACSAASSSSRERPTWRDARGRRSSTPCSESARSSGRGRAAASPSMPPGRRSRSILAGGREHRRAQADAASSSRKCRVCEVAVAIVERDGEAPRFARRSRRRRARRRRSATHSRSGTARKPASEQAVELCGEAASGGVQSGGGPFGDRVVGEDPHRHAGAVMLELAAACFTSPVSCM